MASSPSAVRRALTLVTSAAVAEAVAIASRASTPDEIRGSLFEAAPLIINEYAVGATALALDWYEEKRDEAAPAKRYTPRPFSNRTERAVAGMVAESTGDLRYATDESLPAVKQASLRLVGAGIQKFVAGDFWDTMTNNSTFDPAAKGWQRYARAGCCKFCAMVASRGAVFTESTVHFASHTSCHCLAGPSFDPDAPLADVMQYTAQKSDRTQKQKDDLRSYLNENFPDNQG